MRHVVLIVAFLGASLAAREGRHLSIDVLSRLLPPRPRLWLQATVELASCAICALLAHAAWKLTLVDSSSVAFRIGLHEVPRWPFYLAVALGFALLAFRFALRMMGHFFKGWSGEAEEAKEPFS